jgi:hypothetical protein
MVWVQALPRITPEIRRWGSVRLEFRLDGRVLVDYYFRNAGITGANLQRWHHNSFKSWIRANIF